MIILRKKTKVLTESNDIFQIIDGIKTYIPDLPDRTITNLCQNAFYFCVKGAKMRLGNGYIIENTD